MERALLIDIGSTYTKVTAVDRRERRVIGTARSFTTVKTDVNEGLANAVHELERQTGRVDYDLKLACSSAAGGLRMIAVGLVPDLTVEAARMAALSAGAKVIRTYSYELSDAETEEIGRLKPDIVLLAGGTDGGNKRVILHNAEKLAGIAGGFPVVVAGNKSACEEARALLEAGGRPAVVCENVMKEFNSLNIEPARAAIREIFLERIVLAKGLTKVRRLIEGIVMPTPAAVLKAVNLLANGAGRPGLGDLMAVDVGGATTDVYSVAKGLPTKSGVVPRGLPEPVEKRTVEGDLGVRYSAEPLSEAAGMENICRLSGLSRSEADACMEKIRRSPDITSSREPSVGALDVGLAGMAVRLATRRHAGRIEEHFSPFGTVYVQRGKDLTGIRKVIGTGGPIIDSISPWSVLNQAKYDPEQGDVLCPKKPEFLVDREYILAAMGLLSDSCPELAFDIMVRELV